MSSDKKDMRLSALMLEILELRSQVPPEKRNPKIKTANIWVIPDNCIAESTVQLNLEEPKGTSRLN